MKARSFLIKAKCCGWQKSGTPGSQSSLNFRVDTRGRQIGDRRGRSNQEFKVYGPPTNPHEPACWSGLTDFHLDARRETQRRGRISSWSGHPSGASCSPPPSAQEERSARLSGWVLQRPAARSEAEKCTALFCAVVRTILVATVAKRKVLVL